MSLVERQLTTAIKDCGHRGHPGRVQIPLCLRLAVPWLVQPSGPQFPYLQNGNVSAGLMQMLEGTRQLKQTEPQHGA